MKKTVSNFIFFFLIFGLFAQIPQPCGTPASRPPGCLLCGPTYTGNTGGFAPASAMPHPCGTFDNSQIITVVADANGMITATAIPSGCANMDGIEILIVEVLPRPGLLSCQAPPPGISTPVSVSAGGLIPGNPYGIIIDGVNGDVCDFTLNVTGAEWTLPPNPPGPIRQVPENKRLCVGSEVCYEIDPLVGVQILEIEWSVPNNTRIISGGGLDDIQVCIEITSLGGGVVRAVGLNPCHSSAPAIFPIVATPIPVGIEPPINVCPQDLPVMIDGFIFNNIGLNEGVFKTVEGCDSIVNYLLIPVQQNPATIDTSICIGESVMIGPDSFDEMGVFNLRYSNPPFNQVNGCDSIVSLLVRVIDPEAIIQPPPSVSCAPGSTVQVDGSSSSSGDNVTYQWNSMNGGGIISGGDSSIVTVNQPGTYILTVVESNDQGTVACFAMDTVTVDVDPIPLSTPIFISPVLDVCANTTTNYDIAFVIDATDFLWVDLNGDSITGIGRSIPITVGDFGGNLCVEAVGPCGNSVQECITINVNGVASADFSVSEDTICLDGGSSIIQYIGNASPTSNFVWNLSGGMPSNVTGPGPHTISWNTPGPKTISLSIDSNGCGNSQSSQTIQVDEPLPLPVLNCTPDLDNIIFNWDPVAGASEYSISINGNPATLQTNTDFTVSSLSPGTSINITVTAIGNSSCGTSSASLNCIAQTCPPVTISIVQIAPLCLSANTTPIQLIATPMNGAGGGSFTWSGPGTSPTGLFDPAAANFGNNAISVQYQEGTCVYTSSTNIIVYPTPSADFTLDSPICIDENSRITYTGTASTNADFNWDFGGGTIISGTGSGPYQVQWLNDATISLSVRENGCTSAISTLTVDIDMPLAAPEISCLSTSTTSVTFSWNPVPGATSYIVNGPTSQVDLINLTATIDGLNAGDAGTIEVIAIGNNQCGNSQASFTCVASNCTPVPIDISPIGPFCDDGNNALVTLSATAGDNTGTFTWSGPGVSGNTFDPDDAAINGGTITIRVSYEKDNCIDFADLQVVINEQPSADFMAESPICIDERSNIEFTGNPSGLNFNWNFDSGTPDNSTALGPHQVSWSTPGSKNITLVTEEDNCFSEPNTQIVLVEEELMAPDITCTTNQNSITFNWPLGAGVLSYDVNLISGTTGVFDGIRTYTVNGLSPGDFTEIEVIANGITACGPAADTLRCEALDCPEYIISLPQVAPICLDPTITAFQLDTLPDFSITDLASNDILNQVSIEWVDENGANAYITPGGRFSPNQAALSSGFGARRFSAVVEYPIGSGCIETHTDSIIINPMPNNSLVLASSICVDETANLSLFSPTIDVGATFDWDFGNAVAIPGSGEGPHDLNWSNGGVLDSVTLVITSSEGCVSNEIKSLIRIDETLDPTSVNLRCNLDNTNNQTVEFNWDEVPGITNYDVNVLSPNITPSSTSNTSAIFENLIPGTTIDLELILSNVNSECPQVSTSIECKAVECENPTITFLPIADNCFDPNNGDSFRLEVMVTPDPSNGGGVRTWSGGSHITADGIFTPTAQGDFPIIFELEFDGCTYRNTTTISMFEIPEVDFTVDSIICQTDAADLRLTGAAPFGTNLNWDFDGGDISGSVDDPQTIRWATETGEQTITLNLDNNGCTNGPFTQIVQVDPVLEPIVINCNVTLSSPTQVAFDWNDDPNVDEYEIFIEYPLGSGSVSQNIQTNSDFIFDNVVIGDSLVSITVQPISTTACPQEAVSFTCESADCPALELMVEIPSPVCIADDPIQISPTVLGGNGMEIINISGNGTSNDQFDPATAGIGLHLLTFQFSSDGCDFTETREIEVIGLPQVEAGEPKTLSCNDLFVEIGDDATQAGLNYVWTLAGDVVGNTQKIEVETGGLYFLEVSDNFGCSAIDSVLVDDSFSDPEIIADFGQISCFGQSDGRIELLGIEGSLPPFEYSINGEPFMDVNLLEDLGAGVFTIIGRGSNGCRDTLSVEVSEPNELFVEIQITDGQVPVPFSDSVELTMNTNADTADLVSIDWSPADELSTCDSTNLENCISQWVSPQGQVIYTVRIENNSGCVSSDEITIVGRVERFVYIPTAFSPGNRDQINDVFGIFGNPKYITNVKSFLIFDRWGEVIFENFNFLPSATQSIDPDNGWDGTFRGQILNPAVFTYFAEIEFFDGVTEIIKGDVVLK